MAVYVAHVPHDAALMVCSWILENEIVRAWRHRAIASSAYPEPNAEGEPYSHDKTCSVPSKQNQRNTRQ
jgi:hypothetical protein